MIITSAEILLGPCHRLASQTSTQIWYYSVSNTVELLMLNTSLGFKYGSSWPRYVLFVNLHVNCCTYYDTSFRQFIKMTACYPWVVDLTAKKIPSPTEKDYLVTSVFSVVHVLFIYILLNYDTEIVYYFPCLSIFIYVRRKIISAVKVHSRAKSVYSFFFFFIYTPVFH